MRRAGPGREAVQAALTGQKRHLAARCRDSRRVEPMSDPAVLPRCLPPRFPGFPGAAASRAPARAPASTAWSRSPSSRRCGTSDTGRITGEHTQRVRNATASAGCVAVPAAHPRLPLAPGSSPASAQQHGNAPAAPGIVRGRPDPSVVQGAPSLAAFRSALRAEPLEAFDPRLNGVWTEADATSGRRHPGTGVTRAAEAGEESHGCQFIGTVKFFRFTTARSRLEDCQRQRIPPGS